MFPRENRFQFKDQLPKKIINSSSFTVRYGKNEGELKVAIVVSKKVDKRAVVRNKIKRKVSSILEKKIDREKTLDLIFYIKKAAITSSNLEEEIEKVIKMITNG